MGDRALFRHQLLLAFEDGQPHTVGELYSRFGRLIKMERVARMFQEDSRCKWSIEEKLYRGRLRCIISELAGLRRLGHIEEVPVVNHKDKVNIHRAHFATEKGIQTIKRLKIEKGLAPEDPSVKLRKRKIDPVLEEAHQQVKEAIQELVGDQWVEYETVLQLSVENISPAVAQMAYRTYGEPRKEKTPEQMVYFGRRLMFTRHVGHLNLESKLEGGKKWLRKKPANDGTFPKLAKIG